MATSESGGALKATGSESISAPGGMMTVGAPAKVRVLPVVGSITGESGAIGRAMRAEVMVSGPVPKAFERWTRSVPPPAER